MEDTLSFFPRKVFAKPPGPSPLLTATPVLFSLALGDGHGRVISGGQRGLKGSEKCHGLWEGIAGSAFFPWLCLPQAPHRAGFVWPPPWSEAGRGQHGGSRRGLSASHGPRGERSGCSRPCGGRRAKMVGGLLVVGCLCHPVFLLLTLSVPTPPSALPAAPGLFAGTSGHSGWRHPVF